MNESGDYFDHVRQTYLEAWPEPLERLSINSVRVQISRPEAIALGRCNGEWGQVFYEVFGPDDVSKPMREVEQRVAAAMDCFPNGSFVRLGSRSPKDSWEGHNAKFKAIDADQAIVFLTDSSERIHDDLMLALHRNYLPSIYLREWLPISPEMEFRCFMRERELIGISKYDSRHIHVYSDHSRAVIEEAIRDFFPVFRDACHLDDVVFDVFLTARDATEQSVRLLEINPFGRYTDPCFFEWDDDFADFDGSARFAKKA